MQAGNKIDHPAVNQKNLIQEVQTIGQEFLRRDVDRRQSGQPHNIPSLFFVSFLDIQSFGYSKFFRVCQSFLGAVSRGYGEKCPSFLGSFRRVLF